MNLASSRTAAGEHTTDAPYLANSKGDNKNRQNIRNSKAGETTNVSGINCSPERSRSALEELSEEEKVVFKALEDLPPEWVCEIPSDWRRKFIFLSFCQSWRKASCNRCRQNRDEPEPYFSQQENWKREVIIALLMRVVAVRIILYRARVGFCECMLQ